MHGCEEPARSASLTHVSTTTRPAEEVFRHHARALIAGDLDEIVSDYADDALFITGTGARRGKDGVREAFAAIFEDLPTPQWYVHTRILEGDVLFLEWSATATAAGARADDGVETFLVRDGEIVLQTMHYTVQPA
jgi:uncharacterized protein (TIGR02246 family)